MEISSLDQLYSAFDGLSMEGGWHRRQPALWPEPVKNFLPFRWSYEEVKPILDAAGRLVHADQAERRNLTMTNPVEGNLYSTVRTIVAAYQMIKPGETAKSHRHTPNALRLILDGVGTYTVVNGVRVEMRPGDVLLTPRECWHSHENVGSDDCYWLDFLDVPLVHLMESMFYERHPDGLEPNPQDVAKCDIAFRWEDTQAALSGSSDSAEGMCSRQFELGDPAMETIRLYMQAFDRGVLTRSMQTTANSVFAVVEGAGESNVGNKKITWQRGDVIAVPAWQKYSHFASEDSVLLRVTDRPVFEKLGWLKECVE